MNNRMNNTKSVSRSSNTTNLNRSNDSLSNSVKTSNITATTNVHTTKLDEDDNSITSTSQIDQKLIDSVFGKAREYKKLKSSTWLLFSKISVWLLTILLFINIVVFCFMFFYSMYQLNFKTGLNWGNSAGWKSFYFHGLMSPISISSIVLTLLNLLLTFLFHILCLKFDDEENDDNTSVIAGKISYYNKWNLFSFLFLLVCYIVMMAGMYLGFYNYGYILLICSAILILLIFMIKSVFTIFTITYMYKK